ncbi:MAG: hypothetical protein IIA88_11330 [Bacteroidetes bacterium]|nr:hypothetical protein [Bacteroidota bacterium]
MEDFSLLPLDDKQYVIDIIKKQLIEAKRDVIAERAKDTIENIKQGKVKKGTTKDLYKDLEND